METDAPEIGHADIMQLRIEMDCHKESRLSHFNSVAQDSAAFLSFLGAATPHE